MSSLVTQMMVAEKYGIRLGVEPTRGNTASCTAFRADPIEQTCIAITLCAAEIGRKMKGNQA